MYNAVNSGQGASTSGSEYLAYFLHRHLDFRLPELESLIDYEDKSISYSWRKPFKGLIYSPFWYLRVPSEEIAKKLCNRVLLLKVTNYATPCESAKSKQLVNSRKHACVMPM